MKPAEPTTEATILRQILIRASQLGAKLFRNQTGQYKLADPECAHCRMYGRVLRSGLCVGSADLIGWTAEGRFIAIEVKGPAGRATPEQQQFIDVARACGAVAVVARSVEEAEAAIGTRS